MSNAADTAKEFTPGGEYWTAAAVKVEFRGWTADGNYIVAPYYEAEYYDGAWTTVTGEMRIEPKLYHEPPVELISEKTKALNAHIAEAEILLSALKKEITDDQRKLLNAQEHQRDLIATLEKTEALQRCVDWIDGKFTHFVIKDGDGYRVEETAKSMKSDQKFDTIGVKLLTLGGRSKNSLQWNLHEYSDGSGFAKHVWMFKSEDDAQAFRIAKIMADLQDAIEHPHSDPHWANRHIAQFGQTAMAAGCDLSAGTMLAIRKAMLAISKKNWDALQSSATKAQQAADSEYAKLTNLEHMIEHGDRTEPAPLAPMPGPDDDEIPW